MKNVLVGLKKVLFYAMYTKVVVDILQFAIEKLESVETEKK